MVSYCSYLLAIAIATCVVSYCSYLLAIAIATCMVSYCSYLLTIAIARGEAIMLVKLSIILFSNSHNFTYYAHRFYLLFSKLCLV